MNLLNLNEDCLLHIFSFLDISDLQQIAKINEQFNYLAIKTSKLLNQFTIHITYSTDIKVNFDILQTIGSRLKWLTIKIEDTFEFSNWDEEMFFYYFLVLVKCENLKSLRIQNCTKLKWTHFRRLEKIAKQLSFLELSNCNLDCKIESFLKKCTNLRHLIIFGNPNYRGHGLDELKNLKLLEIDSLCCYRRTEIYCFENSKYITLQNGLKNLKIIPHSSKILEYISKKRKK